MRPLLPSECERGSGLPVGSSLLAGEVQGGFDDLWFEQARVLGNICVPQVGSHLLQSFFTQAASSKPIPSACSTEFMAEVPQGISWSRAYELFTSSSSSMGAGR